MKQVKCIGVVYEGLRYMSEEFHNKLPLGSNLSQKFKVIEATLELMGPEGKAVALRKLYPSLFSNQ